MLSASSLLCDRGLARLVDLCKQDLGALEVWLFGSRARGDHRPESDYDVIAILPDDTAHDVDDPMLAWTLRRKADLVADLLLERRSDFYDAQDTLGTLSRMVHHEGIRLDA